MLKMYKSCVVGALSLGWLLTGENTYAQVRPDFVLADSGMTACIKIDTIGNLHTAWWHNGGIYYAIFDSLGYIVNRPREISVYETDFRPRLALNDDYVFIVWRRLSWTFNSYIYGQLMTIDGNLTDNPIRLNDIYYDAERAVPDVAFINDTTFIVIWGGDGPLTPSTGVYGQIVTTSLNKIGGNLLLSDYIEEGVTHVVPKISISPNNDKMVVVWKDNRLGNNNVYGRVFSKDGTPQGSSFQISVDSIYIDVAHANVVLNPSNEFFVIWQAEATDFTWDVYIRHFNPDGIPIGARIKVNQHPTRWGADISSNIDGVFVIEWSKMGMETNLTIMAQQFSDDGTMIGNKINVSDTTINLNRTYPSVDLHDGKIYSAWQVFDSLFNTTLWANILDYDNPQAGIMEYDMIPPESFLLHQNYPNPFNTHTKIRYEIKILSPVTLTIYNILGREIKTLAKGNYGEGKYETVWNGKDDHGINMASGIYILELIGRKQPQVKKILLLR